MKLAEALAQDMPLKLSIKPNYRTRIAWLWLLRAGGDSTCGVPYR